MLRSTTIFIIVSIFIAIPSYAVKFVEEEIVKKQNDVQVIPATPEKETSRDENIVQEEHPNTSEGDGTAKLRQESAKSQPTKDNEVKDFKESKNNKTDFLIFLIIALVVYVTWKLIKALFRAVFRRGNKEDIIKEDNPHVPTEQEIRKKQMINKYGDEVGGKIVNGEVWVGMDEDQLYDSKGIPDDMKQKQTLKRTITTYYYGRHYGSRSAEKFEMRVTIENGKVIQWKDLDN